MVRAGFVINSRVSNIKSAKDALDRVDKKFARVGVYEGVNDGTKEVLKKAKENLKANKSIDTKTLIQAMGRKVKKFNAGLVVFGVIGPRKDSPGKPPKYSRYRVQRGKSKPRWMVPKNYARLVEFGTAPHTVGAGDNRVVRPGHPKVRQFGPPHPGAKPKPFLRPAAEDSRGPVHRMIYNRLVAKLRDATRKS